MEMNAQEARDRSDADQAIEAMADNAASLFNALVERGLTRAEALQLAREWVRGICAPEPPDPDTVRLPSGPETR